MSEKLINETFRAHQPIIGSWARRNHENFSDVYRFVLATIQQPLSSAPEIVASLKAEAGASKWAFGFKSGALDYIEENSGLVYDHAMWLWKDNYERALLSYFASLPGLGLVKGGFFAQLAFGRLGCLDRHNTTRFGLDKGRFAASRFKRARLTATRQAIVQEYVDLCYDCGGPELLWAEWCEYVAERDSFFDTAVDVSRAHLTPFNLKEE